MPGGDRTGPMGMGPMTGRAGGYCAGFGAPGYTNPGPGWGRGMAWGRGRGWGRGYAWRGAAGFGPTYARPQWAPTGSPWDARRITRDEELAFLKGQASALKEELDAIGERVSELESESGAGEKE
jgi:hypothetical protein